jgi:hypothetical protein
MLKRVEGGHERTRQRITGRLPEGNYICMTVMITVQIAKLVPVPSSAVGFSSKRLHCKNNPKNAFMSATGVHDAAPLGGGALLSRSRRRWLRRSACRWWPTRERRPKRAARGRTLGEPRGAVIVAGTALCAFVLCGHVCGFAGSCVVWGVVPWQRVSAARSPPMNIHVSGELLLWNHQPKQHSTSHGLLQVEDRDRGAVAGLGEKNLGASKQSNNKVNPAVGCARTSHRTQFVERGPREHHEPHRQPNTTSLIPWPNTISPIANTTSPIA